MSAGQDPKRGMPAAQAAAMVRAQPLAAKRAHKANRPAGTPGRWRRRLASLLAALTAARLRRHRGCLPGCPAKGGWRDPRCTCPDGISAFRGNPKDLAQ
jgi:hypothetical protein